jgi:MinD superfamily P-loop ATPase
MVINQGLKICDPSRFQAVIDPELCSFCGTCQERCYFNALQEVETDSGDEVMQVIKDKCMGCGLCHATCPEEAISMVEVRATDFIPA